MIESDFDSGDLYGLEACLRDLDEMLARKGEAATNKAVRYALVKTFELTYELAVKAMRKYLVVTSLKTDEAATFDFQDLIRLGDQNNLLRNGWPEWKQYRSNRGRTVHTYGEAVALQISASLSDFSCEVHALLDTLKKRVEEEHD